MADRSLNLQDKQALLQAVKQSDIEKIKFLLSHGNFDSSWYAPVLHAINAHKPAVLRCLLEHGFDVNTINTQNGKALLHEAITVGSSKCVAILLQYRHIDLNVKDNLGWSPLAWAVNCGQQETAKGLITLKCDVSTHDKDGNAVLHRIAENGHMVDLCSILVKNGCPVDITNACGETAIMFAAMEGHSHVICKLLDLHANINAQNNSGLTALMYAIICDNEGTVGLLISRGAELELTDNDGNTAFLHSVLYGRSKIISLLIDKGCNVVHRNKERHSALHTCAEKNHYELIRLLMQNGLSPSSMNGTGKTPLSLAAQTGNYSALMELLSHKEALDIADAFGLTPLHYAVAGNHRSCAKALLSAGASSDPQCTVSTQVDKALHLAVTMGQHDTVVDLLQAGCNVNAAGKNGKTALHCAAYNGDTSIMDLLIAAGAYIDTQNSTGDTPLMLACRRNNSEAVELLLDINCSISLYNSKQMTALHEACRFGNYSICKSLIEASANVNAVEVEGDTPLILATWGGRTDIIKLLLANYCDVNATNETGRTALVEAVDRKDIDIVQVLLDSLDPLVDVNAQDADGDTALIVACSKGHVNIVRTLLDCDRCDPGVKNRWGRNALHEACNVFQGQNRVVEMLLKAGVDPDLEDSLGSTPLVIAILCAQNEYVRSLIYANCDINKSAHAMGYKVSPFELAAHVNNRIVAEMLYTAGCYADVLDGVHLLPGFPSDVVDDDVVAFEKWLRFVSSTPHLLKTQCRKLIRNLISKNVSVLNDGIDLLPLPQQMKSFLQLAELEGYKCEPNKALVGTALSVGSSSANTLDDLASPSDSDTTESV